MAKGDKIIKFKDGREVFFENFFKENFSKFYAFTKRFIRDEYTCEDIVQETFVAVWEFQGEVFDSLVMLNAFIYRSIRNKCLNYLKHHRIRERYSYHYLQEVEEEEYMLSSVLHEEVNALLYEAIRRLSPQCNVVVRLHLEGKKNEEIAREMGISVITVKSHKLVAYRELRRMLKDSFALLLFFIKNNIKKSPF